MSWHLLGTFDITRGMSALVVDSRLTGCGGADPGRHCGGSPCLSHCSQSTRGSPRDCPKLATLLLYTRAHGQTRKGYGPSREHRETHCTNKQCLQMFNTAQCKHTRDKLDDGATLQPQKNRQDDKQTSKNNKEIERRPTTEFTCHRKEKKKKKKKTKPKKKHTYTNANTQNYWTPSTCCIAHTCSKTRETAGTWHQYNIRRKSLFKVRVDDG